MLKSRFLELFVLIGLIVWGLISSFQAMGLSFFVSGVHQYRDEFFIDALYLSVIIVACIGMFSARVAAFLSLVIGIILIVIVLGIGDFHKDSTIAKEFILAIICRPFLAALLLFFLPAVGPLGRSLLGKMRHRQASRP